MTRLNVSLVLGALLVCGSAFAQQGATKLIAGDEQFANKVISTGNLEVSLGKIAVEKSSNQQIKDLGKMMVDEHGKANEQLSTLMQSKGATPSKTLLPDHQKDLDRLSALSGPEFDREYKQAMIAGHQATIADFQQQLTTLSDADLKKFATDTLPALQKHLDMAQKVDLK